MRPPFHPFLLSAALVVALFAANAGNAGWSEIVAPVAGAWLLASLLYLAARVALRDARRAGLAASWVAVLVLGYGHLHAVVNVVGPVRHRFLLVPWTGLLVAGVVAAARLPRPGPVSRGADAAGWGVLAVSLVLILLPPLGAGGVEVPGAFSVVEARAPGPDVYLVVLDEYAAASTLDISFGFDNRPFLAALRARGFDVVEQSRATYELTDLALAAALNLRYHEDLDGISLGADGPRVAPELITASAFDATLRAAGYRVHHLYRSGWEAIASRTLADDRTACARVTPFQELVLLTSAAGLLYERMMLQEEGRWSRECLLSATRDAIDDAGPKFVFVHLLSPHTPLVWDRDGSSLPYSRGAVVGDSQDPEDRAAYRRLYPGEVEALNRRVLGLVDAVAASSNPSIVVLASDHGSKATGVDSYERERLRTLLAVRWPAGEARTLGEDTTLLHALAGVLTAATGAEPPVPPARSYRILDGRFVDVTALVTYP